MTSDSSGAKSGSMTVGFPLIASLRYFFIE